MRFLSSCLIWRKYQILNKVRSETANLDRREEREYSTVMLELRRVGLFLRDDDQSYPVLGLEKVLQRAGIELVVDAWQSPADNLDLMIALGGDGTVLRALTAYPNVPVLAINFGNVGFLTQSDREDFDRVLVRLLADDYFIEERLTLDIQFAGETYRSINEMVLKGVSHMVEVDIHVNDRLVHTPRGDGVIIGTPTGSTAYLLSTGAPLVVPDVDCIIVKGLNDLNMSKVLICLSAAPVTQYDSDEMSSRLMAPP